MFDRAAIRKETLAQVLRLAGLCPIYARQAAQRYEREAPDLFGGLADRFDKDWSALNAQRPRHQVVPLADLGGTDAVPAVRANHLDRVAQRRIG